MIEAFTTTQGQLNTLLFAPFGLFAVLATRRPVFSAGLGALFTPSVETAQAAMPYVARLCDTDDLATNAAGVLGGMVIGTLVCRRVPAARLSHNSPSDAPSSPAPPPRWPSRQSGLRPLSPSALSCRPRLPPRALSRFRHSTPHLKQPSAMHMSSRRRTFTTTSRAPTPSPRRFPAACRTHLAGPREARDPLHPDQPR
ncbi:VanZ family protein [Streptomyces pristinaespiralis]|uniref:VanZ family protein n=1 Tax=Streptomyces pristinaespiralis TaxID=38300 RepID=UPI0033FC4754